MNDKLMIENAGLGIAMGESTPKVIEIADYVTDEDGVAKALEKLTIKKFKKQKISKYNIQKIHI